ncbi:hypothetical protein Ddc_23265 [Ditylenchus destructor]|nr:hypothetical protein Ddc_23265 [Ditylenchus destructor]
MQKRLTASEKEKLDVIQYKAELETAVKQNNDIIKEIAQVKRELSDNQKRLETAVKQNNDTKKEKEKMKEQLAEWERYHRKIIKVAKYGDEIGKEKQEPTNSQRLQQESPPLLVPIMPPTVLKRQNSISGLANGDPAKRLRIDTQKKSGEDDARKFQLDAHGYSIPLNIHSKSEENDQSQRSTDQPNMDLNDLIMNIDIVQKKEMKFLNTWISVHKSR